MRLAPTPPVWYCLFWIGMLGAAYFVVKYGVLAALRAWRP